MDEQEKVRGTITTAKTQMGRVADQINYLAEGGHPKLAAKLAKKLAEGDLAAAEAEGAKMILGSVNGTDKDGKALYYGPHPFLRDGANRFGLWRTELRDQMSAKSQKLAEKLAKRQERAMKAAQVAQEKERKARERAEARAAKLREVAAKAVAEAEALTSPSTAPVSDSEQPRTAPVSDSEQPRTAPVSDSEQPRTVRFVEVSANVDTIQDLISQNP